MKRTVVITGSTSGFGHSLVKEFLSHGDCVIATGRNLTSRFDIFEKERALYGDLLIEKSLDVTSLDDCLAFKHYLEEKSHGIDVLINNAGYGLFGALEDISIEQIRHQFEVNFFGLIILTQKLLPQVIQSKGKIFNLSSVFGFTGFPLSSIYCASKFAVEGFSESLDYEMRPHGVQVCLIAPGGYRTKFAPSAIWGDQPKEIYQLQTQNYLSIMNKMMTRKNYQDPVDLARGVYKLSLQKNLPPKVTFGRDAMMTSIIKKILPAIVLHRLTHKMLSNLFFKRPIDVN
jgi:short-subunit dehydrogenase